MECWKSGNTRQAVGVDNDSKPQAWPTVARLGHERRLCQILPRVPRLFGICYRCVTQLEVYNVVRLLSSTPYTAVQICQNPRFLAVHPDEQVEGLAHLQNVNTHNMAKLTPEFRLLETHVHVSRVLKPIIRSKRVERDELEAQ